MALGEFHKVERIRFLVMKLVIKTAAPHVKVRIKEQTENKLEMWPWSVLSLFPLLILTNV